MVQTGKITCVILSSVSQGNLDSATSREGTVNCRPSDPETSCYEVLAMLNGCFCKLGVHFWDVLIIRSILFWGPYQCP